MPTFSTSGTSSDTCRELRADRRRREPRPARPGIEKVGIDQKLNAQVPLDAVFRAEDGRAVKFGRVLREAARRAGARLLRVPMLCRRCSTAPWRLKVLNFDIGDEYDVVTLSFDPKETPKMAAAKKETYLNKYGGRRREGLALPDRRPAAIEAWPRRRVPVRLRQAPAVRARERVMC